MSACAIASALVAWRRAAAELSQLGATFHAVTDAAAAETLPLKTVISVSVGSSDTRAVVPFTAREEVSASEGARLPLLIDGLERACNGRRYGAADIEIHRISLVGLSFDEGAGLSVKATATWEGFASWR